MKALSATYGIELVRCIYAKKKKEAAFHYKRLLDGYEVEITLLPKKKGQTIARNTEDEILFCISDIEIKITKELSNETASPLTNGIVADLQKKADLFSSLEKEYKRIAQITFNRLLLFFKYSLRTPLIGQLMDYDKYFINPMWEDENDKIINSGIHTYRLQNDFIRYIEKLGVRPLTDKMETAIGMPIGEEAPIDLYLEVLVDAQSAIFECNYRRAVLEMAMACEIAIKQTYFGNSTITTRAYDFLEDKQRISMNITDYIGGAAEYAFGETFEKASSKSDFTNIQYLFRGRNKIVHRGDLSFRDDKGKWHLIDFAALLRWWGSVERLLTWLNSKRSAQ